MKWNRQAEVIIQLTLWVLLFSALMGIGRILLPWIEALLLSLSILFILVSMSYINTKLIIPNFFKKGKFVQYFLIVFGLSLMVTLGNRLLTNTFISNEEIINALFETSPSSLMRKGVKPERNGPLFFITIAVLFISTVYALAKEFLKKENRTIQLEKEKIEHELKFLRTQINPHFLFNALNNLHATVQLYPEKAGGFILKLGEMLRYVLEDSSKKKVNLFNEINYINNYIYFQKQKDTALQHINFEVTGDALSTFLLEPMIFIPLVENAFQHSYTENKEKQYINISIKLNDGVLHFTIQNNLPTGKKMPKVSIPQRQSIGIKNVKRRLALLYPEQHIFSNGIQNGEYRVELIIKKTSI